MSTFDLLNKDGDEQHIQQTKMDKPWREHTEWTEEVGFCTSYILTGFYMPEIYHQNEQNVTALCQIKTMRRKNLYIKMDISVEI